MKELAKLKQGDVNVKYVGRYNSLTKELKEYLDKLEAIKKDEGQMFLGDDFIVGHFFIGSNAENTEYIRINPNSSVRDKKFINKLAGFMEEALIESANEVIEELNELIH